MINLGFQEAHCLWKQLGFTLPIFNPSMQILPPFSTLTQDQHVASRPVFCSLNGPSSSADDYGFQDSEEPNDELSNNESEYGWLISSLEGHDQKENLSSHLKIH